MDSISHASAEGANRRFVILVAAGSGTRLKTEIPKAFVALRGKTLLEWSLRAVSTVRGIAGVVVVHPEDQQETAKAVVDSAAFRSATIFCPGGATRHLSVAAGVAAARREFSLAPGDLVAIHDAARALVTPELVSRCFEAASVSGAATAAYPVRDTLIRAQGGKIGSESEAVSREGLFGMQTPQVFRFGILEKALRSATAEHATDEVSLVMDHAPVAIVEGPASNLKITFPEDLALAELLLDSKQSLPG
jgi:2-C-methyl-D-erythritol 4-phosphate cytidylyltransferase